MSSLTVALVQVNTVVGAIRDNAAALVRRAAQAAEHGASVIVFPELAVSGYPPEDLVLKRHFLRSCETELAAMAMQMPRSAVVVAGCPRLLDGAAFNTAVVIAEGRVAGSYSKIALPNYGVFDEKRVFASGNRPMVIEANGMRLGIHICEDSWAPDARSAALLAESQLDAVINLSASPYHRGKLEVRQEALARMASSVNTPLLYCNLVGGQDELVFDGASLAIEPGGRLIARARQFEEDILYVQLAPHAQREKRSALPSGVDRVALDLPARAARVEPRVEPAMDDLEEVYSALKLGIRDYVDKNGFAKVVVALSGGIDSALVAALATDALGRERVAGVTMPSQYSSKGTLEDAGLLASNLGIEFHTVPIRGLCEAYLQELSPLWKGRAPDITEENLQARIRANIIMALSNKFGWLVLTTGNKSELATGYCTLYGDMVGGLAAIKDVPKTLVFELARWRNLQGGPCIPPSTIERPPSAELRPDQKDTDTLPPYDILDAILELYVEQDLGTDEIIASGFDAETVRKVVRMADRSEYKRRQGAPGIKITPKAFGRDRRMPITNRYGG